MGFWVVDADAGRGGGDPARADPGRLALVLRDGYFHSCMSRPFVSMT